tara:strand:- start:816 stop:2663 length:1848 start_codon:yes stop_codon:yes gene_type:complete
MNNEMISTASENAASKLALDRGRLRSFNFHNGGKKVLNVAVDHLIGLTEEVLFDHGIVCDSKMVNGPVAQGVATACRKILHEKTLTESWQARRDGSVSSNPIVLTGYWKPIVSRRDNLRLPSEYKDYMQYQTDIGLRYNHDMIEALQAWQLGFGPEDKLVLSERDMDAVRLVGYDTHYQPMNIACRVARVYQGTRGAGGYQNGKGIRYSTEFAEGRTATSKHVAKLRAHASSEYGWTKAIQKELGDGTVKDRVAILNKYKSPGLLRVCLEFIYISDTKKSTMIIWRDVHTSLVCHIYAMLRHKELARYVDINHPKWFNRHEFYLNIILGSQLDSAAFFRALTPEMRGLFIKPSFTPQGHGAGAESTMFSVLSTDDKHWNAEAPDMLNAEMDLATIVDIISKGSKAFVCPNQYKLALRAAWPGIAGKKEVSEADYKKALVTIFDDLKLCFTAGFKQLVRFNQRAIQVKEACNTIGEMPPTYTNRFGFKLIQPRWKRNPNKSVSITNRTTLYGDIPTPTEVTFDKRVECKGSEYAVSMPHEKDAEMNVGTGNRFMQAKKDILSIHDCWGVRLEDIDFLDEVTASEFTETHRLPMLNEMGYEVPKNLPILPDRFQITR